jgi:hypothetical protein
MAVIIILEAFGWYGDSVGRNFQLYHLQLYKIGLLNFLCLRLLICEMQMILYSLLKVGEKIKGYDSQVGL